VLTRRDAVHHLLRLGLIAPSDVLDAGLTATEYVGRNRLVQVEVAGGAGYVVKEPQKPGTPDAATMWIEGALYWMSANDPAFAELAPWMPTYYHYDERNALLTTELVVPSSSLYAVLFADTAQPATLRELGHVFALLHGSVSARLEDRTRKLFRTGPAWVLTLGTPQQMFAAANDAGRAILQRVMEHPDGPAALARAREVWRDAHLVHGDAKSTNVLVRPDGSVRVIDWEIAAIGDGLWDVAGIAHSMLIPQYQVVDDLAAAERRARPLLDALWDGYLSGLNEPPPGDDPRVTMLRLTGARLVQMCLETTLYTDRIDPFLEGTLRMGLELLTRPELARARWEEAA
jgi:tRNA A-37 threonylcarbamoyl transferase component Bud32